MNFRSLAKHIADLNDSDSLRDNPEYVRGQIELAINILGIDGNDFYDLVLDEVTDQIAEGDGQ